MLEGHSIYICKCHENQDLVQLIYKEKEQGLFSSVSIVDTDIKSDLII